MALPSALSFISGSSQGGQPSNPTLTPEAIERRQALAAALIKQGMDYSPIQSPWQGVARVTDAIAGPIEQHWADQEAYNSMKAGADQMTGFYQSLLGGQGAAGAPTGTGASAAPTPGTPPVAANDSTPSTPAPISPNVAQYQPLFDQTEQKYGLPSGYLAQMASIESSGNPNAVSPTGAKGLFQFTSGTAKEYGLANPMDPAANTEAAGRLAADNAKYLTAALGRPPTPGELYLAHQQGAQGAAQLLANPDAPATSVADRRNLEVNGYKPGMTAGQFASQWTSRFGAPQVASNTGANSPLAAPGIGALSRQQAQAAPPPQAPPNQVASADPNFVPPMQTGQQQAVPLPPVDPRSIPNAQNAGLPAVGSTPQGAPLSYVTPGDNPNPSGAIPPQFNVVPPIAQDAALTARVNAADSAGGAPLPSGPGDPGINVTQTLPGPAPVMRNPDPGMNVVQTLPGSPPVMRNTDPGIDVTRTLPIGAAAQGGQQQFAPGSLTGAQAAALANQGIRVPQSAVAMPPMPGDNGAPIPTSVGGPQAALAPPATPAPTSGAAGVTAALAAPSPVPAAATPPNLSPGGQQVAQALMPQGQPGLPPGLDMAKVSAIMANPWIPESQKQMLNGMIMQRFQPHKLIPVQTANGTVLVDEMTGQPRQQFMTPNYQKVTGIDGAEHVYNMNDPQQAQLAAGMSAPGVANMLPGQKTAAQMFPGMKPTPDQENYTGFYNQRIAAGDDPSKIPDFQQFKMNERAPLIQNNQETKFAGSRGEALAANVNNYMTGGQNAYKELQALNTIDDALAAGKGHIFTGPGSEMALDIKQAIGNLFGVNPEGTGASEIINKTGAQLASAAAKNLASRPTQFDFATFLKNNPGLDISPQGNAFMINIMKQQAQHEIELGNMATHYKGDGSDWQDTVDQYYKSHPFISPITNQPLDAKQTLFPAPGGQQGSSQQPAGGASPAAASAEPAQSAQPPAGYPNAQRAKSGKWYIPNPNASDTLHKWLEVVP